MSPDLAHAVLRFLRSGGGQAAVRDLDRLLRPRLLRYFGPGPWPPAEADDLVQETLARVYSHVDQLHEPERFVGWLFAIARNVRRSALADWSARRRVEAQGADGGITQALVGNDAGGESAVIDNERRAVVARAIRELPPRQRECLLLRVREEMSYDEIAGVLRLSPLTVRNHLAQAKESLRRSILGGKETGR